MGNAEFKMGGVNSKVLLQYPGGKYAARKILETYIPGISHGKNVEPELVITNFDVARTATLTVR